MKRRIIEKIWREIMKPKRKHLLHFPELILQPARKTQTCLIAFIYSSSSNENIYEQSIYDAVKIYFLKLSSVV